MAKKYYLYLDEQQLGPLESEELENHKVTTDTLVWHEGLPDWLKADKLEELQFLFTSPAVPPPIPSMPPPVPPSVPPPLQFTERVTVSDEKVINPVSAFEWFSLCWIKALDFKGRARRSEFWYFLLINCGIFLFAGILFPSLGQPAYAKATASSNPIFSFVEALAVIYRLIFVLPFLAVGVRRMHDVGKSGWFFIIPFYNIILAATEGKNGINLYGQDPKN